ncbi:DUF4240 domain-containing protein [Actinoplanes sp. NPDC049118]|uniref:DUF4240 domain-containing protein n=1 Tax=Actinoplanes sp. NPDC049118 TaxID=3155769 RepID=UPI0033D75353
MTREEFWALIGSRSGDDDFAALTDELATRDAATIIAFEDRLSEVLHALDTPAHAKAARVHSDWFLYVRCAAVAAGRETYEAILARPAELRRFRRREAELLLAVASSAYERGTGRLWEHETALSYESGTNPAWGEPPSPPRPAPAADGARPDDWLHLPGPDDWLQLIAVTLPGNDYAHDVELIAYAVGRDPAWRAWWAESGIPGCELFLGDPRVVGESVVLVGTGRVEARGYASYGELPEAIADVTALFAVVRARLGLSEPPPMPDLPDDLPPGYRPAVGDLPKMGLLQVLLGLWRMRRNRRQETMPPR